MRRVGQCLGKIFTAGPATLYENRFEPGGCGLHAEGDSRRACTYDENVRGGRRIQSRMGVHNQVTSGCDRLTHEV